MVRSGYILGHTDIHTQEAGNGEQKSELYDKKPNGYKRQGI